MSDKSDLVSVEGVERGAVNRVSTYVPDTPGRVHELYGLVDSLFDFMQEDDMVQQIAKFSLGFVGPDGELDDEAFIQAALDQFGDRLDRICDIAEGDFPQTGEFEMPPAPSPSIVYNRISSGRDVLDIGSGDCTKVSRCKKKKVIASDKFPRENPHMKVVQLDAEKDLVDFVETNNEPLVMSFNVLTQLDDLTQVSQVDGIHVYPDTSYIREQGVELQGDHLVVGEHRDRIHPVLESGSPFVEGYKTISFFASQRLDYVPQGYVESRPFKFPIRDAEYQLGYPSTPKYDGVCMLLTDDGNQAMIRTRNGRATVLSGGGLQLGVFLEKLPKHGPPDCFVLLRVLSYRGFNPFHGLETLRRFTASVKMKIGGKPVVAPLDPRLAGKPTDGLIFRFADVDYRWKPVYTVEVIDHVATVCTLADKYGIGAEFPDPGTGLCEYKITRRGDIVVFNCLGPRRDKSDPTPIKAIVNYISLTQHSE